MPDKKSKCFHSRAITKEEANAIKAVWVGEATPRQQKLSLYTIVNKFSKGQGLHYIPGSFDETAFVSGRAFVGQKILTMIKVPIGELELEQEEETPNDKT